MAAAGSFSASIGSFASLLREVARTAGTPTYVYDDDAMTPVARSLRAAIAERRHLVANAVKENTPGAIVAAFAAEGCGADVVSGAELRVALGCGIAPDAVVFSGVAKTDDEIDLALGSAPRGIGAIQVESVEEVDRVEARARAAGKRARLGVRVNPSLDLRDATHANIATGHDEAKFGVPLADVPDAVARIEASDHLQLVGMSSHAGSQFVLLGPYVAAARSLFRVVRELRAAGRCRALEFIDTGGGFGIDYGRTPQVPSPADFVRSAALELDGAGLGDLALHVEPGRALVAAHSVLLARVIQTKVASSGRWLMIDAGMNDLLRPALYQAWHRIVPIDGVVPDDAIVWRVVGPVCESSDAFGEHRLPAQPPELVAILDAGAYGYTMASRYNGRPIPAEVFLRGGAVAGDVPRSRVDDWVQERIAAGR